jgi:hypothetical protein
MGSLLQHSSTESERARLAAIAARRNGASTDVSFGRDLEEAGCERWQADLRKDGRR